MDISAATWNTVSKLLDEALDLEPAARAQWIERLDETQPALAPSVRKLLAAHAASDTGDVMGHLPSVPVRPDVARVSALSPGDRVGPYRLKREIGSGGMADVWLAERADGAFTREVALKLPRINRLRRDLAQRFARERDILAQLEHPHIARLYDAGVTEDGLPYLAMEYVDGQPITVYCDEHKLPIEARLKLFEQVLDAVQFAHANLIIHRDLKPSNILVTTDGQVRLLDFGIAKLLADEDAVPETQLTQLSGRAFTPDYASPEQIKGEPLTIATDVYSLGVLLYEQLAGRRPYRLRLESAAQLEQAVLEADPPRPSHGLTPNAARLRSTSTSRLAYLITGDLDTIALKTLAKSPTDRYPTVAALAEDVQRQQQGRPVLAQPAAWTYRAKKFVARNRLPVSMGAGLAVTLLAATVVSLWQAQRAQLAATQAHLQTQRAESVRDFLSELFRTTGSNQRSAQQVRNMTAVQLLERGAANVDALQDSAPDAHAYLLKLFGELHEELELQDRSIQLHQRSVASARKVYGEDAHETVMAEMELAWVLRGARRAEEGWPLVEHAKRILHAIAPRSADYAQALYFEAAFLESKDPKRALLSGEAAVRLTEELQLKDFREAFARWTYANALFTASEHERSITELKQAAVDFERLYGPDYKNLGRIYVDLAANLRSLKRLDEAQDLLYRAIESFQKHPDMRARSVSGARMRLSAVLQAKGDPQGASEQLNLAIRDRQESAEPGLPAIEQIKGMRAMLMLTQGDPQQSVAELSELQRLTPQDLHLTHLAFCDALARAHIQLGNVTAAREQISRGQRVLKERGATSYRAFALAAAAAQTAAAEGSVSEAEKELENARKALAAELTQGKPNSDLLLAETRVYAALGQTERLRAATKPIIEQLLRKEPSDMDLQVRGELAFLAAQSRVDTDAAIAQHLLEVSVAALRKTQLPTSPLLRLAEVQRADLLSRTETKR